jgi:hypothetical protein
MHQEHIAGQNAVCFNCHEHIRHRKIVEFIEPIWEKCLTCHPDHHKLQKQLLSGKMTGEAPVTPGLMFDVRTNCFACHFKFEPDSKDEIVAKASAKACVACHSERHEMMVKEWIDKVEEELMAVREVEKKAEEAIKKARGKVTEAMLKEAVKMFKQGKVYLRSVDFGHGAHNKKYSIMLIDLAFGYFEEILDALEGED